MNSRAFALPNRLSIGASLNICYNDYFSCDNFQKRMYVLHARAVWYVKKGRTKSIVKFQDAGAGGLNDVKATLNDKKVFVPPRSQTVRAQNCSIDLDHVKI